MGLVNVTMERTAAAGSSDHDLALVQSFIRKHYYWPGALRMHRVALGPDLLRAPQNVALAPVFLLTRLVALILTSLRLKRAGRWLATRRIILRTDVSRVIERALIEEILVPRSSPDRPVGNTCTPVVEDYVGIRSAVAEVATTLVVFGLGLIVFRAATPGVLSLAPLVSDHVAFTTAVMEFPLGRELGRAWYGLFPVDSSGWFIAGVTVLLVFAASILTTFAGIVADPVQAALGIHRRRLLRLLARIDRSQKHGSGIAREHLLARMADLTDAAAALLRMLRP
jgi:hypothetical protein